MRSAQNQQTHRDRKLFSGCQELEEYCWGWGEEIAKGYESGASVLGDESGLKLLVVMAVQLHEYSERKD